MTIEPFLPSPDTIIKEFAERHGHSLRQCLFALGKALGDDQPPLALADRNQLSLNSDHVAVDIWQFERHVAADSPDNLQQAAALYGGDLLDSLSFEDDSLDAWCAAERTRLRDQIHEALAALTSHYVDTLNLDAAIETGRRLVGLDPLREDAHRSLIRIYQRAGRRANALKQYRLCVDILRRELNVEPEAATTRLYHEIHRRRDEADGPSEQAVPPPHDGSHASRGGLPGILQAVVRRKILVLVAGLTLLLTLAVIILWLSLWRPELRAEMRRRLDVEAITQCMKREPERQVGALAVASFHQLHQFLQPGVGLLQGLIESSQAGRTHFRYRLE